MDLKRYKETKAHLQKVERQSYYKETKAHLQKVERQSYWKYINNIL
jgi:hypothetical protein